MAHKLVIVESPAKARSLAGFLGRDYVVESSIGHIRDLPQGAADTPAKIKDKPWGRMAVDVDNDFKPLYVVSPGKKDGVRDLKRALKEADELYLATDEDREGEAIAWHLLELLNPRVPVHRMVFHEITPEAIQRAIDEPRELDLRLARHGGHHGVLETFPAGGGAGEEGGRVGIGGDAHAAARADPGEPSGL